MPDDVATTFEAALDLASRPETVGDWIELTAARLDAAGISFGVEELCLTDESRHRAEIGGETRYFACVLDTLLVPFVLEAPDQVAVQTESPVSETVIDVTVTQDGIVAEPEEAVMSFGLAGDAESPAARGGILASDTVQVCPYINAFADENEYEQWVDRTPEATTMVLPLEGGFALAAELSRRLPTDG